MSKTHFGFQTVDENEKAKKVAGVFTSVAGKYDFFFSSRRRHPRS